MPQFTFFDEFANNLGKGLIDLSADTFKAALTNTAPDAASDDEFADITEITAENGYSAGGVTLLSVTWAETGAGTGIWRFDASDFLLTASGGTFGPLRYIVVYSDTSTNDKLVGYIDHGASILVNTGNALRVTFDASGLFQIKEV